MFLLIYFSFGKSNIESIHCCLFKVFNTNYFVNHFSIALVWDCILIVTNAKRARIWKILNWIFCDIWMRNGCVVIVRDCFFEGASKWLSLETKKRSFIDIHQPSHHQTITSATPSHAVFFYEMLQKIQRRQEFATIES